MMPSKNWKFKLVLAGIMAYVAHPEGSRMRVLLVDTRKLPKHPHDPRLRFAGENVVKSPLGIPRPDGAELPGEGEQIWPLFDLDLSIRSSGRKGQGKKSLGAFSLIEGLRKNAEVPTAGKDFEDFAWVADMTKIAPHAGTIKPECLARVPTGGLVVARLLLEHGVLKTTAFADREEDPPPVWTFAPSPNAKSATDLRQACASETTLEIDVPGGPITLVGTPFDGRRKAVGYAFEPRDGDSVTVRVENLPRRVEASRFESGHEIDLDFEIYYSLAASTLKGRAPQPLLPMRQRVAPGASELEEMSEKLGGGEGSRQNCTQVTFARRI